MPNKIEELIVEARQRLSSADPVHGVEHSEAVFKYALKLASEFRNVDIDALKIAAWWHDLSRNDNEAGHGSRNSVLINEILLQKGFSKVFSDKVNEIIANHSASKDIDPSTMSLESKIFRDADKLDLISVYRWKIAIVYQTNDLIEEAIKRLPKIYSQYLILDNSKKYYLQKISEFKKFISSVNSEYFSSYKKEINNLDL